MIFSRRRFFQKTNKRIQLYYYDTSGQLVFVRFWEEIEDTKKLFRNELISIVTKSFTVSNQSIWLVRVVDLYQNSKEQKP